MKLLIFENQKYHEEQTNFILTWRSFGSVMNVGYVRNFCHKYIENEHLYSIKKWKHRFELVSVRALYNDQE